MPRGRIGASFMRSSTVQPPMRFTALPLADGRVHGRAPPAVISARRSIVATRRSRWPSPNMRRARAGTAAIGGSAFATGASPGAPKACVAATVRERPHRTERRRAAPRRSSERARATGAQRASCLLHRRSPVPPPPRSQRGHVAGGEAARAAAVEAQHQLARGGHAGGQPLDLAAGGGQPHARTDRREGGTASPRAAPPDRPSAWARRSPSARDSAASSRSRPGGGAPSPSMLVARARSGGGRPAIAASPRLTPTPRNTSARPSAGRDSARTPASLRPPASTSFGHFSAVGEAARLGHGPGGGQRAREAGERRPRGFGHAEVVGDEQRRARRARPGPPEASASGGLLGGEVGVAAARGAARVRARARVVHRRGGAPDGVDERADAPGAAQRRVLRVAEFRRSGHTGAPDAEHPRTRPGCSSRDSRAEDQPADTSAEMSRTPSPASWLRSSSMPGITSLLGPDDRPPARRASIARPPRPRARRPRAAPGAGRRPRPGAPPAPPIPGPYGEARIGRAGRPPGDPDRARRRGGRAPASPARSRSRAAGGCLWPSRTRSRRSACGPRSRPVPRVAVVTGDGGIPPYGMRAPTSVPEGPRRGRSLPRHRPHGPCGWRRRSGRPRPRRRRAAARRPARRRRSG